MQSWENGSVSQKLCRLSYILVAEEGTMALSASMHAMGSAVSKPSGSAGMVNISVGARRLFIENIKIAFNPQGKVITCLITAIGLVRIRTGIATQRAPEERKPGHGL